MDSRPGHYINDLNYYASCENKYKCVCVFAWAADWDRCRMEYGLKTGEHSLLATAVKMLVSDRLAWLHHHEVLVPWTIDHSLQQLRRAGNLFVT